MLDSSNLSLCSLPFSNYENAIKGINQTTDEVPNSYLLAVFSAFCILPKSIDRTKHPHSMCVMLCTLVRNRGFRACKCSLVMSQFILVYFMVFSKVESTAKILVQFKSAKFKNIAQIWSFYDIENPKTILITWLLQV